MAIFKIYSCSDICNNENVSFHDVRKLKFVKEGFYYINFIPCVAFGRFLFKGYVLLSIFVLLISIIARMYSALYLFSVFLFLFSSELELLFVKLKGYCLIDIVIAKNETEARAIMCGKISRNCKILLTSKNNSSCNSNKKSCFLSKIFKHFICKKRKNA